MVQPSLIADPSGRPEPKRTGDAWERLRVLITVKAAPNPSLNDGDAVCVAGLRIDPEHTGWVWLYPLNFRKFVSNNSRHGTPGTHTPAANNPRATNKEPLDPVFLQVKGKTITVLSGVIDGI